MMLAAAAAYAQAPTSSPAKWAGCCGLTPWAEPGPMKNQRGERGLLFGGYASVVPGSTVRHNVGLTGGIPAPYDKLHNPLPPTPENAQRGAAVYEAHCASCHGATGLGDGPGSSELKPPPAHLGWLANMPTTRRDAFMFWSIAEGGAPFGTGMPSYKGKLSDEEIWSVVGYIQARLPKAKAAPH
jgi:mono/diheme cytochrome c family protein